MIIFGVACLLGGCASTQSRIERNPQLFKSFSPDEQSAIRDGKVKVGFTPEMVKMSWGTPSKTMTELSEEGRKEIWIYTTTKTKTAYVDPYSNYRHGVPSLRRSSRSNVYSGVPPTVRMQERVERARVIFSGDNVEKVIVTSQ